MEKELKDYKDLLIYTIREKNRILIIICTLIVSFLGINIFSNSFSGATDFVKWLVVVFLFLVFLGVAFYFIMLARQGERAMKKIAEVKGVEYKDYIRNERKQEGKGKFDSIIEDTIALIPHIFFIIFSAVIGLIIYLILKS